MAVNLNELRRRQRLSATGRGYLGFYEAAQQLDDVTAAISLSVEEPSVAIKSSASNVASAASAASAAIGVASNTLSDDMSPEEIQLVRVSFLRIMNIKMEVARMFYDRLFVLAPEVRPLFKSNAEDQARKLMDTLALAIGSLRNPATLTNILDSLARRHVEYGVRDEHYDKVGEALLWTLEKCLETAFTPQVKAAWLAVYSHIATRMKDASRSSAASA
jgi:hemoglobin-like flavoprotein